MSSNIRDSKIKDEMVIDLPHVLSVLFKRLWIIAFAAFICAGVGFSYATFAIEPQYSSSAQVLVNNKGISVGEGANVDVSSIVGSLANSDLVASQSLVETYMVILKADDTLELIIEKTGFDMTCGQLSSMISSKKVKETQVFEIIVTSRDPYVSARIAHEITEILPGRLETVLDGKCSMRVVDSPRVNVNKVAPSITRYTAVGFLAGALIACGVLIVFAITDDAIHDENYILETFDFPLLAKVPDLYDNSDSKYSYYSSEEKEGGEATR